MPMCVLYVRACVRAELYSTPGKEDWVLDSSQPLVKGYVTG